MANASVEIVWLKSLLFELKVMTVAPARLWCDNINVTYLMANLMFHFRMKYVEIDYQYFMREGDLLVHFISTKEQLVDSLTKPLPPD